MIIIILKSVKAKGGMSGWVDKVCFNSKSLVEAFLPFLDAY